MKRKLLYSPELARTIAKSVVRGDPIKSLVELTTNCDDSFNRLPIEINDSRIIIAMRRGREKAAYLVSDNAEGMPQEKMDIAVGGYGFQTSGHKQGMKVRGLFGRGLKEAILGLGNGTVESIQDGLFYRCSLNSDGDYESEKPTTATKEDRKRLMLQEKENGTLVSVEVAAKENDVRIPQFDNLKTILQKHVSLRDIMTNPKRNVLLADPNSSSLERLTYRYPLGKILYPLTKHTIPGYPNAVAEISVLRADEELTQDEEGYIRDGGLLVRSGSTIHCATLFKFDNDKNARHLFGTLRCDYIETLIDREEAVISDKRDGLELQHSFVKALRQMTESVLEPLVKQEREEQEKQRKELETEKTKARFQSAIQELNRIAKLELQSADGAVPLEEGKESHRPLVGPQVTFQFSTNYAQIVSGRKEAVYLKAAVPTYLPTGTKVRIESNNPEVMVLTPEIALSEENAVGGVINSKVDLEGRQVGVQAIITASAGTASVTMLVKVISKRVPSEPAPPKPQKTGLFKDIHFNDVANPTQRAYFDPGTGIIEIYTRSESVAMYLGPRGENQEKPECQVLESELIVDLYCRYLAKQREEKGLLLIPSEKAKLDAIDREHEKLRTKYAAIIHRCIVDAGARRGLI